MADSTTVAKWRKWKAANPGFPLSVHPNGQWCKMVRGRLRFFGVLDRKDEAAVLWIQQRDHLLAGQEPPATFDGFTVDDLVTAFLADVDTRLGCSELAPTTARDLRHAANFARDNLQKSKRVDMLTPEDFAGLRAATADTGRVLRSQGNLIAQIRTMFRWGAEMDYFPPVKFGPRFKQPGADAIRKARQQSGKQRFIDAPDLRKLIEAAKPAMRCMILLGINCGFYAQDSIRITFSHLHLADAYHDFPRVKNGRPRKAMLWPETVEAIRTYIDHHRGTDPSDYVILNQYGRPYTGDAPGRGIRTAFTALLESTGVSVSPGTSIGSLRHTYATVTGLCADDQMIDLTMGHTPKGLRKAVYVQRNLTELDRLREISETVRSWLYSPPGEQTISFKIVG